MTFKTALVAGAAAGAFTLFAFTADAATTHHKKHVAAAPSKETTELKEEVSTLKAQLQALEARLDAQAQAQQATQTAAQTAQSQALAAQSSAQAAQAAAQTAQTVAQNDAAKIETLPGQIEKQAKAPKNGWWQNGWWNDTKVGGVMFADISNIDNKNAAGKTAQSGTDFDIKRMYLTVEHKFNKTYSFNLTTDFNFDSNTTSPSGAAAPTNNEAGGANTASGIKTTQLYLKKAYLQANYADAFNVRLGSADLPWVPFVEGIYGYRYVENVLIDRTKFGTSADWGVHVYGSLFNNILSYAGSVIDGEGYRQPSLGTVNRTNAVDVEGRISATYKHFTAAVGGYDGKLGGDVSGIPTYNTAERFDALVAYTDSRIRLGGEYFSARYWKDVTQSNPAKTNVSDGYSGFASYNFTKQVALFGRYDWVKPKANTVPSENDNFFNVGISYKPIAPLDFALVYKRDSVINGSFSTADGVIGVPTGASTGKGTYDEFGLFTQVRF